MHESSFFSIVYVGHQLDVLARQALWKVGLDYLHGTGHGVGSFLNVHEGRIKSHPSTRTLCILSRLF